MGWNWNACDLLDLPKITRFSRRLGCFDKSLTNDCVIYLKIKTVYCIHIYIVHMKICIYIQYIISYTSSVSKKKILEPDVLQTNANHLVGIPGASHLSLNSDVYLRRNCTSQSWIKPFVVLGIFSTKARDPFIIHPCFFMFVQYDFNDPLRGPWRLLAFMAVLIRFGLIGILLFTTQCSLASQKPVPECCNGTGDTAGLQQQTAAHFRPQGRGDRRVYTYIIYICMYIYIYIDCYVCVYIYMYLSIVYIITSSPQKGRAALPTTIIWLLKTDDWQTNFLTGTNHPSMVFKF